MNPWAKDNDHYHKINEKIIDFRKISIIFIICGVISLLTAWFFSFNDGKVIKNTFSSGENFISDPIYTKKYKTSYNIDIIADIVSQSSLFIEGEVLDQNKEYLFSFGKELWKESGRDSEGYWSENNNHYNIKITFPNPGTYYINLKPDNVYAQNAIAVFISKKNGSHIPHLWFGIITLIIGIILYYLKEIKDIYREIT